MIAKPFVPPAGGQRNVLSACTAKGAFPAEAALTLEILKADALKAAANRLGITLATAYTHLAHVFDKTDTRRQAELVRLLLQSQPGIREE